MPEETAPTNIPTDPADSGSSSSVLKSLGCGGAMLVVLVVIVPLVWASWGSTDSPHFPRTAPQDMAGRAFQHSQEAYDLIGFKRTVEPGVRKIGVSTQNTLSSSSCYDVGLLGMENKTVVGAYEMYHSWALDHVPASQAASGLRRLRQHLKDKGWEITSYQEGTQGKDKDWDLFVKRDDGDGTERMSFTWFSDREYFHGSATAPCAFNPAWKDGDIDPAGDHQTPPALGPHSGA
ncbi:hypothetical protein [Streptomyces hygroscopicus]|uniref:hypothetical protein n=1 Tax=Streptomyces hygroscopicus TaxID=1912 RepID=UPI001FCB845A|nr:hypothetical protein [Streptomyces hygroscopicus]BDH12831.1 hypothetical protein HOK021_40100 [Streptomyces hygroscopicus]